MPAKLGKDTEVKIELLARDYDHRFQETMFHSQRYHRQINYLQVYLSLVVAGGGAVASGALPSLELIDPAAVGTSLVLVLAAAMAFYIFATVLDSLYMIYLSHARLSMIEQAVEDVFGEPVLGWASRCLPAIHNKKFVYRRRWVRPPLLVGIWSFTVFGAILGLLVYIAYLAAPGVFFFYAPVVLLLAAFHVHQWTALHRVGKDVVAGNMEAAMNPATGAAESRSSASADS